jgi:hypothetical protein
LKSMCVDGSVVSEAGVWYWEMWRYIVANPNALRSNQDTFCCRQYGMVSLGFVVDMAEMVRTSFRIGSGSLVRSLFCTYRQ